MRETHRHFFRAFVAGTLAAAAACPSPALALRSINSRENAGVEEDLRGNLTGNRSDSYGAGAAVRSGMEECQFVAHVLKGSSRDALIGIWKEKYKELKAWLLAAPLFQEGSSFRLEASELDQLLLTTIEGTEEVWPEGTRPFGVYYFQKEGIWISEAFKNSLDSIADRAEEQPAPSYKGVIQMRVGRKSGFWFVELSDNGTGIPRSTLENLFRFDTPGTRKDKRRRLGHEGKAIFGGFYGDTFLKKYGGYVLIDTKHPKTGALQIRFNAELDVVRKPSRGRRKERGTTVRWVFRPDPVQAQSGLEEDWSRRAREAMVESAMDPLLQQTQEALEERRVWLLGRLRELNAADRPFSDEELERLSGLLAAVFAEERRVIVFDTSADYWLTEDKGSGVVRGTHIRLDWGQETGGIVPEEGSLYKKALVHLAFRDWERRYRLPQTPLASRETLRRFEAEITARFPAVRLTQVGVIRSGTGKMAWLKGGERLPKLWFQKQGFVHF